MAELEDEIDSLQSFYCKPGEFIVTDIENSKHIKVDLVQEHSSGNPVCLTIDLMIPNKYPDIVPDILLDSLQLKRDILTIIRKDATECAHELRGQCMIFSILQNIQDNLNNFCDVLDNEEISKTEEDVWNVLLELDHMRAKTKYIKTIKKWTHELGINGRLFFCGKLIYILLQGDYSNIKEYIVRQRSVKIDVDSQGRSCKERMMTVLCEEKALGEKRYTDFDVEDCVSMEILQTKFSDFDLTSIYSRYIKP